MAAAQQSQPSSSAAGTEQRAALFTSGMLPVMLQHPAISSDCKTVCRLLASSRALRSAVLQHASGMADLQFCLQWLGAKPQQLCSWLCSHGQLLRSIKLDSGFAMADAAHLAYALQAAAAATPGGLRLQELQAFLPLAMAGLVLQPLPAKHLTRLELQLKDTDEQQDRWMQLAAQALAGLTNLSILSLGWSDCMFAAPSMDAVVPSLSGLSRLTKLELGGISIDKLALLPQQLVELDLCDVSPQPQANGVPPSHPSESLALGHLTALTHFKYHSCHGVSVGWVQAGDALPPNLLSLVIEDCSASEPLAALTRLTRLELSRADSMSVARLVGGIAGLYQLQQLEVTYVNEVAAEGSTAAWPAAVLPALVELSVAGLHSSMFLGAADAVSRLSALTRLSLSATSGEQDVAAIDVLARAIVGLPRLQELSLSRVVLGRSPAAAELLSAATGLTSLKLWSACLTDHSFSQLFASGLPGLRSLDMLGSAISVPCLLVVVTGCLPHLVELVGPGGSSEADARCWRRIESVLQQRRQAAAGQ